MRAFLPVLFLILANIPSSGEVLRPLLGPEARMTATPVRLDSGDSSRLRVGALTFLGGVRLNSPDPAFGGFSAMWVAGDRFMLLSDGGNIVRFRMGADWRPFEIAFGDLAQGPGTGWPKSDRDTESLVGDPATGRFWVGFEQENAIWRYDALGRSDRNSAPPAMARWRANGGAESMVRLSDGGFVVIAETSRWARGDKGRAAVRFAGDPTEVPDRAFRFAYLPPEGYSPSDMAALPDGRLLVLNRRLSLGALFTAKLVVVDAAAIRPGALVRGSEIATIGPPLTRDNFEALAVVQEAGATIVWIASDDNRQWPQRSLLMKFRLDL